MFVPTLAVLARREPISFMGLPETAVPADGISGLASICFPALKGLSPDDGSGLSVLPPDPPTAARPPYSTLPSSQDF